MWNERVKKFLSARYAFVADLAKESGIPQTTIGRWLESAEMPRSRAALRFEKEFLRPFEGELIKPSSVESFKATGKEKEQTAWREETATEPTPVQRITIIQNLAEMNRVDLLEIKKAMEEIVERMRELSEKDKDKKRRA